MDQNSDVAVDAPPGFNSEEITVLVVVPDEAETHDEFMERYRRLFGNLNRYAKPTDQVTNIIMDEDDAFAIITRRLITYHEFFKAPGRQKGSVRIKTTKGKNLKSSDSFFTSLETFYEMNIRLLMTNQRRNTGWDEEGIDESVYKKFRPLEEEITGLFNELVLYWDGLLQALPDLRRNPTEMRNHSAVDGDFALRDSVLFWPIGQDLLADVARDLLNYRQARPEAPTEESVAQALSGLGKLNWAFHSPPWRHLLLIPDNVEMTSWKIRSEDRKPAQRLAKRIIKWQIGLDELAEDDVRALRGDWESMLLPALSADRVEELWISIEEGVIR